MGHFGLELEIVKLGVVQFCAVHRDNAIMWGSKLQFGSV